MIHKLLLTFLAATFSLAVSFAQENATWDLQKCITYALENNIQVKQMALGVDAGSANLRQAKTNRYPNLNGGANLNTSIGYVNDPFTNEFDNQTITSSNYSISTNFNIFSGFQTQNTIAQRKIDLQANEFDLKASQNDITLAVANAYLSILFNRELVSSAQAQLTTTRERRERTKKLVDAGTLAVASLLDLESQIATEELQVVNQQNLLNLAYLNLQQLLTLDPDERFEIAFPDLEAPENTMTATKVNDIYRTAVGSQPNIRAAELRISSADYGIKVAKGDRLPSLGFGANVFTGYSSARDRVSFDLFTEDVVQTIEIAEPPLAGTYTVTFPDQPMSSRITSPFPFTDQIWENRNFGLGLNLNVPIYNRGFFNNNIQQAEIAMERARYDTQLQKQTLKQTIQQAYLDMQAGYTTYTATQKQIKALELTFQNTEKQFNLGILNSVDYLQAKNNLARAQNDLVRAKYDFIFRGKILDFYNGKTITLD